MSRGRHVGSALGLVLGALLMPCAATGAGAVAGAAEADAARAASLPLEAVEPRGAPAHVLAVMLTGDGGWAPFDRSIAAVLAQHGVGVVGWDALRYLWTAKTPAQGAADLAAVIAHYGRRWQADRVIVSGYSLGAGAVPFFVRQLPADLEPPLVLTVLLAPGTQAYLEFHVELWAGQEAPGGRPLAPELVRWPAGRLLCLYGREETDSACPGLRGPDTRVVGLPGGHHFNEDAAAVAGQILAALPARPKGEHRRAH